MTGTTRAGPALLRQLNTRRVLAALQQHGPMSRADLSRHTGISGPTVTRTVADLLEASLLEEGEARQASVGRPGKVLRLARTSVSVLGAVIGVERCEVVSAGLDGQLHEGGSRRFPTPPTHAELLDAVAAHAAAVAEAGGTTVLGLGLSVPGLLHRRGQRTVVSPNLHQIDGHALGAELGQRLGLETVTLQESHALCLAERAYGAARGVADFAMLDITGGLGLGVVHHGQLIEGHSGLAGELGHLTVELDGKRCGCGNRGCLETVATDAALAASLSERLARPLTVDEALAGLRDGSIDGGAELERLLQFLAVALAAVINIFNPSQLFVYGRVLDVDPDLTARLVALTRKRALGPSMDDCAVIRARGNKRLGAVAGIIRRLTTGREGGPD